MLGLVMTVDVSVVLGTYNRLKYLKIALESIRREVANLSHEIIVVDGGSNDGTLAWLTRQKDILTIVHHNHGVWQGKNIERLSWGFFMNLAFKVARGKYVCMLSDDCLVIPRAIINGYSLFEDRLLKGENLGAIAFYWRNWPEKGPYFIGLTLSGKIFVNHGLYLRQALEDVGYIDENTYQFYHADGDLCLKMWQKGYVCIASSESFIEHYSHANISARASNIAAAKNDWENYLNKWENIYYSKGLTETGGCVQVEFSDPLNTADMFRKVESLRCKISKLRKTITRTFIK